MTCEHAKKDYVRAEDLKRAQIPRVSIVYCPQL